MKRLFALMIGACIATGVYARTLDEIKGSGTISFVTTASSPPHGFVDPKTGKLEGVMVDVASEVAKRMGLKASFVEVPFGSLIPTLTSDRADALSAPLFMTPERAKVIDFTQPVYGWGPGAMIKTGSKEHYAKFEDFAGKRVGLITSGIHLAKLQALPGTDVVTYADMPSMITDVISGRIQVGMVDPPSIVYQLKSKGITQAQLDPTYRSDEKNFAGLGTVKGRPELLAALNAALTSIKADGTLQKILNKWDVGDTIAK